MKITVLGMLRCLHEGRYHDTALAKTRSGDGAGCTLYPQHKCWCGIWLGTDGSMLTDVLTASLKSPVLFSIPAVYAVDAENMAEQVSGTVDQRKPRVTLHL